MMAFDSLCVARLSVTVLLLLLYRNVEGLVTLSPSEVAWVCRGHQLDLTCCVTGSHLEWSFFLIPENRITAVRFSYAVTSLNPINEISHLQINSTMFTFSRSSAANSMPLVSRLTINATGDVLNGTIVTCSDVGTSESASIIVHVINLIQELWYQEVENPVLSEYFKRDSVICTLELKLGNPHYSYNVSVVPPPAVPVNMSIESGRVNFTVTVFYNTHYNVSIYAAPPCGEYNATTFNMELYYVKCEDPAVQIVDSQVEVEGYSNPALEGTNITLSCSSGQVLTGSNLSTAVCMWNGKWKPDLGEIECKATCDPPVSPQNGIVMPYSNTLEGSMVTFMCWTIHETRHQSMCKEMNATAICNAGGNWEPSMETICAEPFNSGYGLSQDGKIILILSTVIVVTVTLLGYSFGFLCGYHCQKMKEKIVSSDYQQRPNYNMQLDQVELSTNVAYDSIQRR